MGGVWLQIQDQHECRSGCRRAGKNRENHVCVCSDADDSEEENLESDLGQVGNHAFARMEGDVDKQRKQVLQGQMSEAAAQKQHQRK